MSDYSPTYSYSRVSTKEQVANGSIEQQRTAIYKFVGTNAALLKSSGIINTDEFSSAYKVIPPRLWDLIQSIDNSTIVFYDVSRFSRCVELALQVFEECRAKNIRLIFVSEGFVFPDNVEDIVKAVECSEKSSQDLGRRIKAGIDHIKSQGYFVGRVAPFGRKIEQVVDSMGKNRKMLVPSFSEMEVVHLVTYCRDNPQKEKDYINNLMKQIVGSRNYVPVEFYNKRGFSINVMTDRMYCNEIASLLNSYGVTYRGKKWTADKVNRVKEYTDDELQKTPQQKKKESVKELIFNFENLNFGAGPSGE